MAILKLRDEAKLSLNDPVAQYIDEMSGMEYPTGDAPTIDIENLLTMTAGFPEDNPWGDRQLDEPDQMLMDLVAEGISFSNPSSYQYEYSNTGYALLGNIISRVSGKPYQQYIRESILQPLGMNDTHFHDDHTMIVRGRATGYSPRGTDGYRIHATTLATGILRMRYRFLTVPSMVMLWSRKSTLFHVSRRASCICNPANP